MCQRHGHWLRQTEDSKPLKFGYREEWKRPVGLTKLLMRKFLK